LLLGKFENSFCRNTGPVQTRGTSLLWQKQDSFFILPGVCCDEYNITLNNADMQADI
jgi:hypothetical protein